VSEVVGFQALLPPKERAQQIASVPYDVVDTHEAAALADGNPWSFLHVIRPEIDLPEGTDLYSDTVYEQAKSALQRFIEAVPYESTGEPALFIYRLIQSGRSQVGVVGCCSVDEYDAGGIAIHERTRKAKEDDRTRHVVTMGCQAEPIFLAYRSQPTIDDLVEQEMEQAPLFDFVAPDEVHHTLWRVADPARISQAFESVPRLYVADGHHRAKSASRARSQLRQSNQSHRGDEAYNRVMAVVFPDSQLSILPYNRVVTDLGSRSPADILGAIGQRFPLRAADAAPDAPHSFRVYAEGSWHAFEIPPQGTGVIENLDVSLLQEQVLAPILGIEDPRTDARISFVGGSRGTGELEKRADKSGGVAFSLYATSMAELFAVADGGEIMPPKSTWFEPKLRSGLFLHSIR